MTPHEAEGVNIGDTVIAATAGGDFKPATVTEVPRDWRDSPRPVWTTKGKFPKMWLRFTPDAEPIPWPIEYVTRAPRRSIGPTKPDTKEDIDAALLKLRAEAAENFRDDLVAKIDALLASREMTA